MDYQKIYNQIVERAKNRTLEGYKEKHHVIPKCLGGSNEKFNIVELTAREHFICHWLLYNIYPNNKKITFSFWMMSKMSTKKQDRSYTPSSRIIEHLRKEKNRILSESKKGKPLSEKNIKSIREWHKNNTEIKKVRHSEETKRKIGLSNKGKIRSEETRLVYSLTRKGRKLTLTDDERLRRSQRQKGIPKSEEHKRRVSNKKKGVPQQKLECPHCKLLGGVTNMKRYHFDNCNKKIQDIYLK